MNSRGGPPLGGCMLMGVRLWGQFLWIIRYLFLVLFIFPSSFKFGKALPNEVLLPCQEKPLNPLDLCIK